MSLHYSTKSPGGGSGSDTNAAINLTPYSLTPTLANVVQHETIPLGQFCPKKAELVKVRYHPMDSAPHWRVLTQLHCIVKHTVHTDIE